MKTYTISEVAKLMNTSASAIRYYDNEGLLPNVRKVNGRRVFTESDMGWLKILGCMKSIGVPIREIRRYVELAAMGDETLADRLEIILKQKESVQEQIAQLQKSLETIEYKVWYYETAIAAGTEAIHREKSQVVRDTVEGE